MNLYFRKIRKFKILRYALIMDRCLLMLSLKRSLIRKMGIFCIVKTVEFLLLPFVFFKNNSYLCITDIRVSV